MTEWCIALQQLKNYSPPPPPVTIGNGTKKRVEAITAKNRKLITDFLKTVEKAAADEIGRAIGMADTTCRHNLRAMLREGLVQHCVGVRQVSYWKLPCQS